MQDLIDQMQIELNTVQKSEEYLRLANENHHNTRRRLESKILELQHEYQNLRSNYSRLNASCIS